jgi:putative lipoic acid-binding regulatory protein
MDYLFFRKQCFRRPRWIDHDNLGGRKEPEFESTVLAIFRRHVPALPADAVSTRDSGGGKFTALTVTVTATSQQQLDDLYRELSRAPAVLMAL